VGSDQKLVAVSKSILVFCSYNDYRKHMPCRMRQSRFRGTMESNPAETTLSIRLPIEILQFVVAYEIRNGLSPEKLFNRYLSLLKEIEQHQPSQPVRDISGLVPSAVDAITTYKQQLTDKYKP